MQTTEHKIKSICNDINRRIYMMDYETQKQIMEYLQDIFSYSSLLLESESDRIASILDVNENCIYDLLTDLELIEE